MAVESYRPQVLWDEVEGWRYADLIYKDILQVDNLQNFQQRVPTLNFEVNL